MNDDNRDRLLRRAWELGPFEERVGAISQIAQRIGSAERGLSPRPPAPPYTLRNLAIASQRVSRARGGGATTLPGKLLLHSMPRALRLLAGRMPQGCILVSGTNGKTTTAAMLAAILRAAGLKVVHNRAGANGHWGVATALLEAPGEIGVFEIDEAWLPILAAELCPRVIVLGNLFRDRLDAYGELDALVGAWEAMVRAAGAALVLNADDAALAHLGSGAAAGNRSPTFFFGVADRKLGLADPEQAVDAVRCRRCDGPLAFDARLLSHLGHYRCQACGMRRPPPAIGGEQIELDGLLGSRFLIRAGSGAVDLQCRLALPGLFNVYNALAASAAALALGVEPVAIARALEAFEPVFGRGERIRTATTTLLLLLMKNPAGANELLRTLRRDRAPRLDLLIALNDGAADGRDVSWIWDVDFELLGGRIGSVICSGERAAEMVLRLKYAGWPTTRMAVEGEISAALDRGLALSGERLVVLPTYSALLDLHVELQSRGLTRPYWS